MLVCHSFSSRNRLLLKEEAFVLSFKSLMFFLQDAQVDGNKGEEERKKERDKNDDWGRELRGGNEGGGRYELQVILAL